MSNPLTPAVHGHSHEEFNFRHLERGRMSMTQQIPNQRSVIAHLFSSITVADTRGLNDTAVVSHDVNQTNETVIQHGELLPSQGIDLRDSLVGRLTGFRS
jgi:hypothetical protein